MFSDFIYLAKGFRMRPKVRSTLISANCVLLRIAEYGGISEKPTIIITILTTNY